MQKPLVTIIILNTNRKEDTLECLSSLEKSTYRNQVIIVLDNASTDGSVDAFTEKFPNTQINQLDKNRMDFSHLL